jgi:hypothetical protein
MLNDDEFRAYIKVVIGERPPYVRRASHIGWTVRQWESAYKALDHANRDNRLDSFKDRVAGVSLAQRAILDEADAIERDKERFGVFLDPNEARKIAPGAAVTALPLQTGDLPAGSLKPLPAFPDVDHGPFIEQVRANRQAEGYLPPDMMAEIEDERQARLAGHYLREPRWWFFVYVAIMALAVIWLCVHSVSP